jgi:hypothetical protein
VFELWNVRLVGDATPMTVTKDTKGCWSEGLDRVHGAVTLDTNVIEKCPV